MTTPVGFEPTRGDPIGLAGRRLSRSAKVSFNVREWNCIHEVLTWLQGLGAYRYSCHQASFARSARFQPDRSKYMYPSDQFRSSRSTCCQLLHMKQDPTSRRQVLPFVTHKQPCYVQMGGSLCSSRPSMGLARCCWWCDAVC